MNLQEKKQFRHILLLVFISGVGLAIASPIFPPLFLHPVSHGMIALNMSDKQRGLMLGLALAAFPIGVFFGAPVLGYLADRYGKGKVMLISLFLATLGHLLTAIAISSHSFILLIFSRLFTGFVESVLAIARSLAASYQCMTRQKSIGLVNAVACVSYIAGPLIGGFFQALTFYLFLITVPHFILAPLVVSSPSLYACRPAYNHLHKPHANRIQSLPQQLISI